MAGGAVFFGVPILLTALKEGLFVLLIPARLLLVFGVMRTLSGLLLEGHAPPEENSKRAATRSTAVLNHTSECAKLPYVRTVLSSLYTRPVADTSDIGPPLTVAENTTKLLDEKRLESGRRRR